jgi:hypothetical protein
VRWLVVTGTVTANVLCFSAGEGNRAALWEAANHDALCTPVLKDCIGYKAAMFWYNGIAPRCTAASLPPEKEELRVGGSIGALRSNSLACLPAGRCAGRALFLTLPAAVTLL